MERIKSAAMKEVLFSAIILIFSIQAHSQNNFSLDSTQSFTWEEVDWRQVNSVTFDYSIENQITRDFYYYDEFGTRNNTFKTVDYFNFEGDRILSAESLVDESGEFKENRLHNYIYDDLRNQIEYELLEFDEEANGLIPEYKLIREDFTEFGDHQKETSFTNFGSGLQLLGVKGIEYFYIDERIDSLTVFDGNFSNAYLSSKNYVYEDENLINEKWYRDDYYTGDRLLTYDKDFYYTESLLDSTSTNWPSYPNVDSLYNRWRSYLYYDDNDNVETAIYVSTPEDFEEGRSKVENFRSLLSSNEHIFLNNILFNVSNAGSRTLQVDINNLESKDNYRLTIFDASGRILKYKQITNQNEFNQRFRLEVGFYFVNVSNNETNYTKKVMIGY